jgi:hypothetical protein
MEVIETGSKLSDLYGFIRRISQKKSSKYGKRAQRIVFLGCGGSCTALAELIMYGLRGLKNCEMFYIPNLNLDKIHKMKYDPEIGIQLEPFTFDGFKADLIVLMGGLTIPKYRINIEEVKNLVTNLSNNHTVVVGACANSVFQKAGWTEKINFEYIVDMTLTVFLNKCSRIHE